MTRCNEDNQPQTTMNKPGAATHIHHDFVLNTTGLGLTKQWINEKQREDRKEAESDTESKETACHSQPYLD
jgi:hypothetical protein